MPMESAMAQLSRPFQIALLAVALLAAVWFIALRGNSTTSSSSSIPAPAPSASSQAGKAAAPTPVYHGPAPGVEGLTRAIAKAHAAVATSQQNAKQLEEKAARASSTSTGAASASSATPQTASPGSIAHPTSTTKGASTSSASSRAATHTPAHTGAGAPSTGLNRVPARQALVEQELKQGAVVAVLFWNPKGADDVAVRRELQLLQLVHRSLGSIRNVPAVRRLLKSEGLELDSKIAVQEASASQVTAFGSITRGVRVYQTPTILIINRHGQTTTLTGLTDAVAIEQAIDEARHS
jgi:hypothetical protein